MLLLVSCDNHTGVHSLFGYGFFKRRDVLGIVILSSVHPEIVDFGPEQGMNFFEATGIVYYFEDFKKVKTQLWAERCHLWMDTKPSSPANSKKRYSRLPPEGRDR